MKQSVTEAMGVVEQEEGEGMHEVPRRVDCKDNELHLSLTERTAYRVSCSKFKGSISRRTAGPRTRIATDRVASAASLYSKLFDMRRSAIRMMSGLNSISAAVGASLSERY